MSSTVPRIVIVTRATPYEELVRRHATPGQARFFLRSRGRTLDDELARHERFEAALCHVESAIPSECRRACVDRLDLPVFAFEPDDVVVVVGQDGLVANVAKYLDGQTVLGVNSDPERYDGVLCRLAPEACAETLERVIRRDHGSDVSIESRTMVEAERGDGAALRALNEIFVGHRSHQSARYRIRVDTIEEAHSSSGFLCASGTGATGWARSIAEQRRIDTPLPRPDDHGLVWFVREPFPSIATRTTLDFGRLAATDTIEITSDMGAGGVVFGDGIESDALELAAGERVTIRVASRRLRLVTQRVSAKRRTARVCRGRATSATRWPRARAGNTPPTPARG